MFRAVISVSSPVHDGNVSSVQCTMGKFRVKCLVFLVRSVEARPTFQSPARLQSADSSGALPLHSYLITARSRLSWKHCTYVDKLSGAATWQYLNPTSFLLNKENVLLNGKFQRLFSSSTGAHSRKGNTWSIMVNSWFSETLYLVTQKLKMSTRYPVFL